MGCIERVEVPAGVYDELREQFVVAPGHEQPDRDLVVADEPGYNVVALRR
jgi:hypothetical protein